jgi:hypothetical protein
MDGARIARYSSGAVANLRAPSLDARIARRIIAIFVVMQKPAWIKGFVTVVIRYQKDATRCH